MHTQFLTADLADELHLVVAPFFVGDSRARRFVSDGRFPWNPDRRATLAEVRQIGDVVLLRYALSPRFRADSRTSSGDDLGTGYVSDRGVAMTEHAVVIAGGFRQGGRWPASSRGGRRLATSGGPAWIS